MDILTDAVKPSYKGLVLSKLPESIKSGFKCESLNTKLFPFQKHVTAWALELGRAAVFLDTGLGKTRVSIEWAYQVYLFTGQPVLIVTPLAVAQQFVKEGKELNYELHYCRSQEEAKDKAIVITNYEMLKAFDLSSFVGVSLDESSILKSFAGKTKSFIVDSFSKTPYRLAATATPSPVWFDIDQSRTLNYKAARDNKDERHICPLQLDVIGRAIDLWTNKGDTVFSPFAGIGSEVYEAVRMHRKGLGVELKPSYFDLAVKHVKEAEMQSKQVGLFEVA